MTAIRVTLIPTLARDGIASLDRFARELSSALAADEELEVTIASHAPANGGGGRARFWSYPRAVRRLEADVFHVLDQGYAHLGAVLPRDRVVVTCHDLMPLRGAKTDAPFGVPATTAAWYRMSVSFLRRAAHVACVSEATRRDVLSWLSVEAGRTSVIPQGLSPVFRPLEAEVRCRARAEFPPEVRLLLHVGSGAVYKNVEGTLGVLAELRGRGQDTLLLRAGAGLTPDHRAVAERLGVAGAVRDLGAVTDERLVELYNIADAMLFPSYWEGFGWPALEALACGTPTVVSDCPPLRETVGDAALAAPADDHRALADAVVRLWESADLRHALGERGRARAAAYSWTAAAEAYSALYRRLSRR